MPTAQAACVKSQQHAPRDGVPARIVLVPAQVVHLPARVVPVAKQRGQELMALKQAPVSAPISQIIHNSFCAAHLQR